MQVEIYGMKPINMCYTITLPDLAKLLTDKVLVKKLADEKGNEIHYSIKLKDTKNPK